MFVNGIKNISVMSENFDTTKNAQEKVEQPSSAFDRLSQVDLADSKFEYLLNSESIIGYFVASKEFAKWTYQDYFDLLPKYLSLISSGQILDNNFFVKSLTNLTKAIKENTLEVKNITKEIDEFDLSLQKNVDNFEFAKLNGLELKKKIEDLQIEKSHKDRSIEVLQTIFSHVDGVFGERIFDIANKANFEEIMVDFLLEQKDYKLSETTMSRIYIACQDQFHRLDEKTAMYLVERNDKGIEYLLGNLKTVSFDFFAKVVKNTNIPSTAKNIFYSKVKIVNVSSELIKKNVFNNIFDEDVRNALCYSKELSPETCQKMFYNPLASVTQKIALLSRTWASEKEHDFELVKMFDEKYSNLSEEQTHLLIQAVWLSRGKSKGINPPTCKFTGDDDLLGCWLTYSENFQKSKSIDSLNCYGYFEISLQNFMEITNQKGLNILLTVIHEMEHAQQSKIKVQTDDVLSPEMQMKAVAYAVTFHLLPYKNAIFFASVAPIFVQRFVDLVSEHGDMYFFDNENFNQEDYFDSDDDYKKFIQLYKGSKIGEIAWEMSVAKEIIAIVFGNDKKRVFDTLYKVRSPHDIYLNFSVELDARQGTIDFLQNVSNIYKEKQQDSTNVNMVLKALIEKENKNSRYGHDLEDAILYIGTELVKKEVIILNNIEKIEKNIYNFIKTRNQIENKEKISNEKENSIAQITDIQVKSSKEKNAENKKLEGKE